MKSNKKKGVLLAGGLGARLFPVTNSVSKHLLPLNDKPMIYYPLSTLMLAGVRDILLITNERDLQSFKNLLSDGNHLGINISYKIQDQPLGVIDAFLLAEDFIENNPVILILGDNFFHGSELIAKLQKSHTVKGATIYVHFVKEPSRYGVVEFDKNNKVIRITEKPKNPKSNYVITGIYFFDETAISRAKNCNFSERGELEVVDIINSYLFEENLSVEFLGRGNAWLDTGNWESFYEATSFIKAIENRQGQKIACPEEISWRNKWIKNEDLIALANTFPKNEYRKYLLDIVQNNKV